MTIKNRIIQRVSSPYTIADFHFFATLFWILLIVPTLVFWMNSVAWVVFMSLYAIVTTHATGISASKGEQQIKEVADKLDAQ